ncbi:unnamed protein product [Darwinula stevensoni]|uniref:Uncharacterized protein n=1 Tax=Darwinula stevensoni TaxID=69355 RepID=A0A7R8X737_9CRUS|nr:unnamed protein product [Darwinula stevensoni]CAG0886453.1 unnamed protein product [Darwinula stevensoni]
MGAGNERPWNEAASEYLGQHYPEAYTKAYSLPEGYILSNKNFNELRSKAIKGLEDVNMPLDQVSVVKVFSMLKDALKDAPSLTLADYAFTDTLLKGVKEQQKKEFEKLGVPKEYLEPGDHDVFGVGLSGEEVVGIFFQVKGTMRANRKTILKTLGRAIQQVRKDIRIFKTVCGEFLASHVKLAGFAAFPMLSKADLQNDIKCEDCRARILTSEDLDATDSFKAFLSRHRIELKKPCCHGIMESPIMKTFRYIFDLYVCAASAVDLPRSFKQLSRRSGEQMEKMIVILTPQQRELVKSDSKMLFICGAPGTGKTFVIKKRALLLGETGEVLLINVAGGLLTTEFQEEFSGNANIQIIDGRKEGLEEDLRALKKYISKEGKGKHVLMDEVPITIGFQDIITPEALSKHWEWIADLENDAKSITVSFRPNDQTYTRDFPLEDMKLAESCHITILNRVKRNTQRISGLFTAIGNFSRRVFVSSERSTVMDVEESSDGFLPRLFTILSCQALHRKCKNEQICESVRASHAIHAIHEQCSQSTTNPIFVVVDTETRKNALVNIFSSSYDSLPFLFRSSYYSSDGSGDSDREKFRGKPAPNGSNHLVILTEKEVMGYHPKNLMVVVDFPLSQWMNYNRLIATTGPENKIILIEDEELRTGRFSRITKEIQGWTIEDRIMIIDENLHQRLQAAFSKYAEESIHQIKNIEEFPLQAFPEIDMFQGERMEDGNEEVQKIFIGSENDSEYMVGPRLVGIFGSPASGKSKYVDLLIRQITKRQVQVLLLHPEDRLTSQLFRMRWRNNQNLGIAYFPSNETTLTKNEIKSPQDIINHVMNVIETWRKEGSPFLGSTNTLRSIKRRDGIRSKEEESPMVVIVEDCPLFEEFGGFMKELKTININLILAFEPHSKDAISVEAAVKFMEGNCECRAIVLGSQPTNKSLVKHIQKNETRNALKLKAKSLSLSSEPAVIVLGSAVRYILYECSEQHFGYKCKGSNYCIDCVRVAASVSLVAPPEATDDQLYILASDENLLASLGTLKTWCGVRVVHPKDFRGCEASAVIAVNVSDEWLLEVISRSRTQLIIIDTLSDHEDLWDSMRQEQRVEVLSGNFPTGIEDRKVLLTLDEEKKFLWTPTWDKTGERIGEEALKKEGFLDQNTGGLFCLSDEPVDKILPSPPYLDPFAAWGYAWGGNPGEVSQIGDGKRIIEFLGLRGVKWEPMYWPPVPLKVRSKGTGLLESLSIVLTGSLMHLPLLKKRLKDEYHSSSPELNVSDETGSMENGGLQFSTLETLLHQIQLAATILRRPIVLFGNKLSCTFLPEDTNEEKNLCCVLFIARDNLQPNSFENPQLISIIPIVPHWRGGDVWMGVEKLPPVYGNGQLPSTFTKILFRGKANVGQRRHLRFGEVLTNVGQRRHLRFGEFSVSPKFAVRTPLETPLRRHGINLFMFQENSAEGKDFSSFIPLRDLTKRRPLRFSEVLVSPTIVPRVRASGVIFGSVVMPSTLLSFASDKLEAEGRHQLIASFDKLDPEERRQLIHSFNKLDPEERSNLIDSFDKPDVEERHQLPAPVYNLDLEESHQFIDCFDNLDSEERRVLLKLTGHIALEMKRPHIDFFDKLDREEKRMVIFLLDELQPKEMRRHIYNLDKRVLEERRHPPAPTGNRRSNDAWNLLKIFEKLDLEDRRQLVDFFDKLHREERFHLIDSLDKLDLEERRTLNDSIDKLDPEERRPLIDSIGKYDFHFPVRPSREFPGSLVMPSNILDRRFKNEDTRRIT